MQEIEVCLLVLQTIKNNEPQVARDILVQNPVRGDSIDILDSRRDGTCLYWSSCKGYVDVVRILVRMGASVHCENCWGGTALHGAAEHNHEEIVRILLKQEADPNRQTLYGDTPTHLASYRGYMRVIHILVEAGANLSLLNIRGRDVIAEAEVRGHIEVVKGLNELQKNLYTNLTRSNRMSSQARKRRGATSPLQRDVRSRRDLHDDASFGGGSQSLPTESSEAIPTFCIAYAPSVKQSVQRSSSDPITYNSDMDYLPSNSITKYPSTPEVSSFNLTDTDTSESSFSSFSSSGLSSSSSLTTQSSRSWDTLHSSSSSSPSKYFTDDWNSLSSQSQYSSGKDSLYADKTFK